MITPDLDTKDITDGYELVKSKIKFIEYKNHSIAARNNKLGNLKRNCRAGLRQLKERDANIDIEIEMIVN